MSGVSFLPYDNGIYQQAPYEVIDKDTYNQLLKTVPKDVNWKDLIEVDDNTTAAQELACTAGSCEL